MAKIRLSKADRKLYSNIRNRVNYRIKSAQQKGFDISNEISLPRLNSIKTREEYNSIVSQAKSFIYSRDYKYVQLGDGSYVPQKEFDTVKTQNRIANLIRRQKRKKIHALEKVIKGEEPILSKYEFGERASTSDIQDLPKITSPKKIPSLSRFKNLKKFMAEKSDAEYLEKVAERGRENFLNTLEELVPNSDVVSDLFASMPVEEFWFMYKSYSDFSRVFFGSKQDELQEQGIETTYTPPKVTELLSRYEAFQRDKKNASNKK